MALLAHALEAVSRDRCLIGKLARFRGRDRLSEDVALDHADPKIADEVQVIMSLDALGAGIHTQRLGEGDNGADDRRVAVGRRGGPAHEALVDLDLVERRFLQIAERAVASPEIVEREAYAELLQR